MDLNGLLEPASIAIVGASTDSKKLSGMILDFLLKSGFGGQVFPVNPRYAEIGELACYASIEDLPVVVDLLVCVVPVSVAFEAIEAAARRGVRYCVLMTGGFGEGRTGAEGEERKLRLQALCRETGMHVVGPNTVGMVNFRHRMPVTFADWYGRDTGQRGGVAIVTHSGSVGGLIFSSLQLNRIGVDYWIGLGNEATLETADFIAHFSADPSIHTVICYLEGVQDGRKFFEAAEQARLAGKRIVVLKSGEHPDSVRSTIAHTGKHPTSSDVYTGVFQQLGVIQVASLAELSYVMTLLTTIGDRLGPRVGIISASGGACSVIADHVIQAGLQLPELPSLLQQTLDRGIPVYGSSANPVDLSADVVARGEILEHTLAALREDDSINIWMVFGRPVVDRYHRMLIDFATTTGKAMVVCCGVPVQTELRQALTDSGIAVLDDPELCVRALGRIVRSVNDDADLVRTIEEQGARPTEGRSKGSAPGEIAVGAGFDVAPSAVPWLRIAIEQDRDFGPIVTAKWLTGLKLVSRRVVRALPAGTLDLIAMVDDLGSLVDEWPAERADIEDALQLALKAYRLDPDIPALNLELGTADGRVAVCGPALDAVGVG